MTRIRHMKRHGLPLQNINIKTKTAIVSDRGFLCV